MVLDYVDYARCFWMMLDRSFPNEVQTNLENAASSFDLGDMDACI